jgi:catecholate siderophore receptor
VPDGAVPTIGIADYANAQLSGAGITAPRVDSENFYGLKSDYEDIKANMFTVRIEHDFSPTTTLRNTARYGKSSQERVLTAPFQAPVVSDGPTDNPVVRIDPDTWTLNRNRQASFRDNKVLTNQTNLTTKFNTGSIEHSLSSGVEFIYESQFTPTITGLGTLAPTSLYNPSRDGVFTVAPAIARSGAYSDGNTTTSAVYAFDTWELNPRWQLSTGLRWEHYETETQTVAISTTSPPVTTSSAFDDSGGALSWKVGALFKPTEYSSVYVAFANSIKPPGADNFTLAAATPNANNGSVSISAPNLNPQKATNIELGTKWDLLDGKLAATAAIFRSENRNDLARTDPGDPDNVIQYGKKEVKGIELGLVGQVTEVWQISAGVTRQDTDVKAGQITSNGLPSTQTGAAINFSPKLSATLWTTYRLPFALTVGGGVRHVDTQARNVNNTINTAGVFEVPSYTVVDFFAQYDVSQNIAVQVNAYNIGDEDYVSSINNSGQRYLPGIPRSYLATVNFKF